ncbi:hypothetical protein [Aquisphaera insulae]|uniref:hypothetical protein n=1 Tax=Aquisphaera insulae TaxID=2712864 RepID=UPI0013EA188A|nr:hypothetical protein [Aquisphaera insulae]
MELTGSGRMKTLGKVSMTGSLRMGGFLIQGTPDPTGTITLTNRRGSVTIALSGDGLTGNSTGSGLRLTATVREGTGAYRNLRWSGAARLELGPNMLAGFAPLRGSLGLTLQTVPRST